MGLAGVGDLYVTVGGGRNGKLGACLGRGLRVTDALSGPLKGETVEGVDTGRSLAGAFQAAVGKGALAAAAFPLASSLISAITNDTLFAFDFESLGRP
jgi:glycerol-3-phosphate dehydrogenase (NAD(P)+)